MGQNILYYGDNLQILRNPHYFPDESVDLIYLDPPFKRKISRRPDAQVAPELRFWVPFRSSQPDGGPLRQLLGSLLPVTPSP